MENGHDRHTERLPRTTSRWDEVVTAFKEGRELRTKKINGRDYGPWWSGQQRSGIRDMVKREDETLVYYLWGSPIATIEGDILTFDNCGYNTKITADRLRSISHRCCPNMDFYLYAGGWDIGWWARLEPYPLDVNLRTRQVLNRINLEKQYQHLGRMRAPHRIRDTYNALKKYGPVPAEIEDRVASKLMLDKLTEAA